MSLHSAQATKTNLAQTVWRNTHVEENVAYLVRFVFLPDTLTIDLNNT